MENNEKNVCEKLPPQTAARMVETIFRCKWSLTIFQLLAKGVNRPGEMVRSVEGLSKKVLHDCLNKNVEFGILERIAHNEVPPRVEYKVTSLGTKFLGVLGEIEKLQEEIDAGK